MYDWCNMPHVKPQAYPQIKDTSYELQYVEVIHRHHKRTPYAGNTFLQKSYTWYCDNEGLLHGSKPINPFETYPQTLTGTSIHHLRTRSHPEALMGHASFPQIMRGGLDDTSQHGVDLKAVYNGMLGFLPEE